MAVKLSLKLSGSFITSWTTRKAKSVAKTGSTNTFMYFMPSVLRGLVLRRLYLLWYVFLSLGRICGIWYLIISFLVFRASELYLISSDNRCGSWNWSLCHDRGETESLSHVWKLSCSLPNRAQLSQLVSASTPNFLLHNKSRRLWSSNFSANTTFIKNKSSRIVRGRSSSKVPKHTNASPTTIKLSNWCQANPDRRERCFPDLFGKYSKCSKNSGMKFHWPLFSYSWAFAISMDNLLS